MKIIATVILLFLLPFLARAGDAKTQQEINYLVNSISNSGCKFIRNGKTYESKDAVSHIEKKYSYFKDQIDSTEKFIELCASKSSMSKKPYQIQCNGSEKINSQEWLLDSLAKYRGNKQSDK